MGTKLQVLSSEGATWEAHLEAGSTVESLKRMALQIFYASDTASNPDQYRVLFPAESRTLLDSHAIHEERLKDNDTLLLVRKRNNDPHEIVSEEDIKSPNLAEIFAATKNVAVPRSSDSPTSSGAVNPGVHLGETVNETSVDFQLELRKIIISLISVMSTLLHGNSDAQLICQEIKTRLKQRLDAISKPLESLDFTYPPAQDVACTPMGIVKGLAEVKRREFRPSSKAVQSLKEMGFGGEQIIEALRATKNSKDAACEWLLAGKTAPPQDVETGLDQNSHLFNALVTSPTIRLGLNSPKTLLAFLGILESPSSANMWLTDQDTAPVLTAIFKIYHAEKHAAADTIRTVQT